MATVTPTERHLEVCLVYNCKYRFVCVCVCVAFVCVCVCVGVSVYVPGNLICYQVHTLVNRLLQCI